MEPFGIDERDICDGNVENDEPCEPLMASSGCCCCGCVVEGGPDGREDEVEPLLAGLMLGRIPLFLRRPAMSSSSELLRASETEGNVH